MKAFACLVMTTAVQAGTKLDSNVLPAMNMPKLETPTLDTDFLTGFESGIFLRDKPEQIKAYDCPSASVNVGEFKKVKDMIQPVTQIAKTMNPNDLEMGNMLDSLNQVVDHMDSLIGVFDDDYRGGHFCAGLTFGQAGSNLLYQIAEKIITTNLKRIEKQNCKKDDHSHCDHDH